MVNLQLFVTSRGPLLPATDARNSEGARAYALPAKQSLAQLAATGTLHGTFYAQADEQLAEVVRLAAEVDAEFVARTAVWCRERGFMKDVPALLVAILSTRDTQLFERTFARVIDDGRMLRSFVQIVRSGVVGRKSLGTAPKRAVLRWLESQSDEALLRASIGNAPSLADVVKMVHPKPANDTRRAFYAWLLGRELVEADLPEFLRSFETKKRDAAAPLPAVPFEMLTALDLSSAEWIRVARTASWQQTRMNLNTFARHGVFGDAPRARGRIAAAVRKAVAAVFGAPQAPSEIAGVLASRLRDPQAIAKAKVLPYQLLAAYVNSDERVPRAVRDALQDALEIATQNVPSLEGRVVVCPDVSGSMSSPITGHKKGATSKVRCIDVAALMAACVLRKNPGALVLPFSTDVERVDLNARDSVTTNATKLAAVGGGGTNCSAALQHLNERRERADLVIFVSDNESWADAHPTRGTALMAEWAKLKRRSPSAKLVCLDIQPSATSQAVDREDVLNVGGFSDSVFTVIGDFAAGRLGSGHWVEAIEAIAL